MSLYTPRTAIVLSLLLGLVACSRTPGSEDSRNLAPTKEPSRSPLAQAQTTADLAPLFNRIWRVSHAPFGPASGSIYIFLPNGTVLETSCVETYRIATWSLDDKEAGVLQVTEDHRPAFKAKAEESADKTLRLRQTLLLGNKETRDLTLTPVDQEFVCPDLRNDLRK